MRGASRGHELQVHVSRGRSSDESSFEWTLRASAGCSSLDVAGATGCGGEFVDPYGARCPPSATTNAVSLQGYVVRMAGRLRRPRALQWFTGNTPSRYDVPFSPCLLRVCTLDCS